MAEIRPRLKWIGSFGLQCSIEFAEVVIPMGLRRRVTVEVDDERGVRSWQLTYKVVPGTIDAMIEDENGQLRPRADYLWEFFCARKGGPVKSFIVRCPREGKDYLAEFVDTKLTFEMFRTKLFTTGLALIQVDEPDVPTLEDGSLGDTSGNVDII